MGSSSGELLSLFSPGLIHGDVSSCSYCSLDTRGSQKVWYKASDLLQCCAQRAGFRRRSTVTVTYFWFNLCCSDGLQAEQCDPSAQFALPYGMVPSVCCSQGCQSQKGWEKFTVVLCIRAEYELLSQLYQCL